MLCYISTLNHKYSVSLNVKQTDRPPSKQLSSAAYANC